MKKMGKTRNFLSLMLALVLTLSMSLTAFAAEPTTPTTYTITIANTNTGHTYEAYQVFTGRLEGNVLSDVDWGDGVDKTTVLEEVKKITAFANCTDAASVAKVLEGYAENAEDVDAFAAAVATCLSATKYTGTEVKDAENKTTGYTISGLPAGYYFIKDSVKVNGNDASTKFILKISADIQVKPKSDVPKVEKKVKENNKVTVNDGYNDVADWNIGDAVPFRLTGTLPNETSFADYKTYSYEFRDTLSAGLTYNSDAVVYLVNDTTKTDVTASFTITPPAAGEPLKVTCENVKDITGVTAASKFVVEYTAKLNTAAVIGLAGNENKVVLEFSNNPNAGGGDNRGTTPEDKVIVFTYELDVEKVDGTDKTTKLPGAEFKLRNAAGKWVQIDENNKVTGWADTEADGSTLSTGTVGNYKKIQVIGLDDGTYYLKETKAPEGYNLPKTETTLVITATTTNGDTWNGTASNALTALTIQAGDANAVNGDIATGVVSTTVENNKGATLPGTGGIGTTIFYVLGAVLVLGSGILLITRRRMSK